MTHEQFLAHAYKGKKVALIGYGQVGYYLCNLLRDAGANIHLYKRDTKGIAVTSENRIWWKQVDLEGDVGWARQHLEEVCPDYVFALAACVRGMVHNQDHHFDMGLRNIRIAAAQFEMCRNLDTRLVWFSSACVFPSTVQVPTPEVGWCLGEGEYFGLPERSNLGYGLAKQFAEWLAYWDIKEWTVVRPWNIYGREHPSAEGHVIPALTRRLLDKEDPLVIRGNPGIRRSLTHAEDVARAVALLAGCGHAGVVHVGNPYSVSIRFVVDRLCRAFGVDPKIEFDEKDAGYTDREPDIHELQETLQCHGLPEWAPRISLDDGIRKYVEWCKEKEYFTEG